ncbi:MAG TPA: chromosomal replication initiator protein DnaA [Terriglobales bacterium]|nr:chromosomal replication initiator protein DnaA [Terriglobales bacterium]
MAQSSAKTRSTWDEILGEVQKQINPHTYNTWLRPTRQERLENGTLYIAVPTVDFERVGEKFGPQIEQAIARLHLEGVVRDLRFVPPLVSGARAASAPPLQQNLDFESVVNSLNPRYTFDTFVVGGSNQFAHAAAMAAADRPGHAYNPLFLYGGVGMGKTHLMHAIGHQAKQLYPSLRIEYVTAERFVNELIGALVNNQTIAFRDRYRSIDVLLIDDIQFIANKERMQEEFFHTFNSLHGAEKQIVISSDRPPKELSQLEERLRSRFEWGLIADLQPPDLETRIAILMRKAQTERASHNVAPDLTPEVAEFIAGNVKSNVRELEGALVRLLAYCSVKKLPVTIPVAQEALKHIIDQQQRKVDIEGIAKQVAEHFSMRVADLKARNNSKHIVYPRQIAMFLAKQLTEASLPEIARFYGGKHHSTVIHSVRKIENERKTNKELDRLLQHLSEKLS